MTTHTPTTLTENENISYIELYPPSISVSTGNNNRRAVVIGMNVDTDVNYNSSQSVIINESQNQIYNQNTVQNSNSNQNQSRNDILQYDLNGFSNITTPTTAYSTPDVTPLPSPYR